MANIEEFSKALASGDIKTQEDFQASEFSPKTETFVPDFPGQIATNQTMNQNPAALVGDQSPTTISSENVANQIPKLEKDLEDFQEVGNYTGEDGVERDSTDKPIPEVDESEVFLKNLAEFNKKYGRTHNDASGITKLDGGQLDTTGAFDDEGNVYGGTRVPTKQEEAVEKATTEQDNIISQMEAKLDAITQQQISNIKSQFNSLRQQQQEINRRKEAATANTLLTSGSSRYAQISAEGLQQSQNTTSLLAIASLNSQEQQLIGQANAARLEGDFKLLQEKLDLAVETRRDKQKKADELAEEIRKQQAVAEREAATIRAIDSGLETAGDIFRFVNFDKFGVPSENPITMGEIEDLMEITTPEEEESDSVGDIRQYEDALAKDLIPEGTSFFDFLHGRAESKSTAKSDTEKILAAEAASDKKKAEAAELERTDFETAARIIDENPNLSELELQSKIQQETETLNESEIKPILKLRATDTDVKDVAESLLMDMHDEVNKLNLTDEESVEIVLDTIKEIEKRVGTVYEMDDDSQVVITEKTAARMIDAIKDLDQEGIKAIKKSFD